MAQVFWLFEIRMLTSHSGCGCCQCSCNAWWWGWLGEPNCPLYSVLQFIHDSWSRGCEPSNTYILMTPRLGCFSLLTSACWTMTEWLPTGAKCSSSLRWLGRKPPIRALTFACPHAPSRLSNQALSIHSFFWGQSSTPLFWFPSPRCGTKNGSQISINYKLTDVVDRIKAPQRGPCLNPQNVGMCEVIGQRGIKVATLPTPWLLAQWPLTSSTAR